MHESAEPTRQSPLRRIALLGVLFVAAVVSCGKDVTGPLGAAGRYVRGLAFNPIFPPAFQAAGGTSSGVVDVDSVHVVLHHADGTVALDTTIKFPAGQDQVTVDLTVKLLDNAPSTGESMSLDLGYLDASGVVVFHGGPVSVNAAPPATPGVPNPPVQVPVTYTGPGASAVSVVISPRTQTIVAGAPFSFSAIARDASGTTIGSTPIIWNSVDPSIASITSPATGSGVALNQRGTARIIAQLFSGATDTALVSVTLPASQLISQSGNAQTGVVGANLANPLVVKVAANDGVGVAGTTVTFAVASGGGSVSNATAVSDANGLAQTTFKLGTSTGAQSVTATAGALNNSPLTFTATAQAATATKLVVTTQPANGVAGTALSSIVVTAQDNNGNVATTFAGPVIIAFGTNTPGATLAGTTTATPVLGVATFSGLTINKNGGAYTLVASASGVASATTNAFDIAVGAPNKLVFTVQPTGAAANAAMTPAIVVNAQDSQGNPTPSFSSPVTLSFATNPTSATLGGTLAVTAVSGAATFSGISVSAPGTGYSLTASATGLTSATSSLFNTGGGVASTMSLSSGGGQTGATGAALAQPVVILVTDAGSNPIAGTTVTFAVVTGGGSVSPTSGVTNASGQVQTTWTLGATVGAQSISATSAGLTGSPLTINATGTSTAATQLKFTVQPSNAVAGANNSPSIVVQARDAGNVLAPSFGNNVTLSIAANPGGSTLGGTVTVAAIGGVATFNNITLNHSGTGYTLSAASGVLATDVSTTFNISAAAASTLGITAGQAQTGNTSAPLATPLGVTILDAFGNAVSGVTVNWATPSGGSFSPASSVTNAAGVATSTWTLGASAGGQTATATSGTLTGSPAGFTANATSASFSKTWTGATSTVWNSLTNWAPAGVPVAGDSVSIPLVANQPTISSAVSVKHLTIASGAVVTLSGSPTLTVTGNLNVTGSIAGAGTVSLSGTGTVFGTIAPNVSIFGTGYTVGGALSIGGNLTTISSLDLAGQTVTVAGAFQTSGSGTITMTSASSLTVAGDITFSGGSETGLITSGVITTAGTFTQSGSATSFVASGINSVHLTSGVAKTLSMSNPGTASFRNLTVANTAGLTLQTDFTVTNLMTVAAGTATGTHTATLAALQDVSAGLSVANIIFNGSTNPITSTPTINANVTFNNNPTVLSANATVNGNVLITGNFSANGHYLAVNGTFGTAGSGQLTMTNASDSISVSGDATFGGGVEAGILTAGKLKLAGNFVQTPGTGGGQEFKASAGHQTVLVGTASQTVSFVNPDTSATVCSLSCFGDFTIAKSGGPVVILTPAGANGSVTVTPGVTAVTGVSFLLVRGATTTGAGTNVHVHRFGTFGALSLDASTIADTIQFHGTSAQVIPTGEYNEVVIKGSPTVGAGGFIADGSLTVDGGAFALGGQAVSVFGGFLTTGTGVLKMSSPVDSLLVVGQATFNGGAEAGLLTDGALVLFKGIAVTSAGQFNASGNHTTYLVGPNGGCDCANLIPSHHGTIKASTSRAQARTKALLKAFIEARRAKSLALANGARAQLAAVKAARKALASKWTPSSAGIRMAAAAGKNAKLPHAVEPTTLAANKSRSVADVRINGPRINAPRAPISAGGTKRAASIAVQSYSLSPVYVAFATPSGNQFGNVRIVGQADWQTLAAAAGNVQLDTTSDVSGSGHLTVGGDLIGDSNSTLELETVELFGVLGDAGVFEPDTTVFSGASQTMPSQVGGSYNINYTNVVVNSPALGVPAEDDEEIDINGSLFIQNSGVLRIGLPIAGCMGCDSDELYVSGAFETHGSGALQMTDNNFPFLTVSDSAWFAGGSTSGLLTQGEIDFYGNFRQAGSTTAYAATSPHFSYLGRGSPQYVTFANSGAATSHFGDFYLGGPTAVFMSNVYASGSFQTGHVIAHTAQAGTAGVSLTSLGADVRDLEFDGVTWTLLDGYDVTDMDVVEFANENPAATQFTMARSGQFALATLTGWSFDVTPTSGKYMSVTDIDGATNGVLTVNMSGTSPGSPGSFTSTSGGAVINGWTNFANAMWLGLSSNWNDGPNNWSTGVVPDANTNVTISCDCSSPTTPGVVTVHDLTITNGNQLSLGGAITVNGNLSIQSGSDIAATYNVVALGNVTADPTSSTAAIFCNTGTTGLILAGSGTQNVTGRFCRANVLSTAVASGRIYVKNTTNYASALTIQSGGSLDLNGHSVETDSMITAGTGTFSMTHGLDSLIIHGASGNSSVNFAGGSETGLITSGTVLLRSPNFRATGTAFDAAGGSNTVVADSTGGVTFRWTGATVGHGFNNLILMNSNLDSFQQTLVVTGVLLLDGSMGTSGLFGATAAALYAGRLVDNTGNPTGGFSGAYWLHVTANGAVPAKLPVDSLFFENGATMQLAGDVSTNAVVVRDNADVGGNTTLFLHGHIIKTNNSDFRVIGTSQIAMQMAGDSLDIGTGSIYFNGGTEVGALTTGGINAHGFYQGYTSTSTLASGASPASFQASGAHRVWLTGSNSPVVFANPGTSGGSSYFNSLHQPAGFTTKLYGNIVVGDTLYVTSGSAFSSDQPNVLGQTRFVTAAGLADFQSSNASFINVGLKFVDGQPAPSHFDVIAWSQFPTGFTGNMFEIARTVPGSATSFLGHVFNTTSFGTNGTYVNNTGSQSWTFTSSTGSASLGTFTLTGGQHNP